MAQWLRRRALDRRPGFDPDVTKDPPSAWSVLARKIRGSENTVVAR